MLLLVRPSALGSLVWRRRRQANRPAPLRRVRRELASCAALVRAPVRRADGRRTVDPPTPTARHRRACVPVRTAAAGESVRN